MKSQKNEISKKKKKKKMKTKNFINSKISEMNQPQCKTMSASDNLRIMLMSESDNVSIQLMSESDNVNK